MHIYAELFQINHMYKCFFQMEVWQGLSAFNWYNNQQYSVMK